MTTFRGARALATAALLLAVVAACGDEGTNAKPSETPSPTAPTSSAPTPATDSEIASTAASALVRNYYSTFDHVRQDPNRPAAELDAVAASSQLVAIKNLLKRQRSSGLRQVGDTKLVTVTVESVSLDDPATAYVDVCWDVSGADVLDSSGKSVVKPERKDVGWTRFTVTNPTWKSAPTDGWRVTGGADLEKEPCAAS